MHVSRKPAFGRKAGVSLIEVSLSLLVVAIVVTGAARAFSSSLNAVGQAKRTTNAAIFLETTMEDISAQPYANLLTLNGNQVFDRTDAADSEYSIRLSVFQAELELIQIRAIVTDLDTNREMGRVTALRSSR